MSAVQRLEFVSAKISYTVAKYNWNNQVEEDEMGRACSTHGDKRFAYRVERDH
jgi:hypothetical protein